MISKFKKKNLKKTTKKHLMQVREMRKLNKTIRLGNRIEIKN